MLNTTLTHSLLLKWRWWLPRKECLLSCHHMQRISQVKFSSNPFVKIQMCTFKGFLKVYGWVSRNRPCVQPEMENMFFIMFSWFILIEADCGWQWSHEPADVYYASSALRNTGLQQVLEVTDNQLWSILMYSFSALQRAVGAGCST